MLSLFTKVKGAKADATVKPFTFVTRGSEVHAPRTCPEADYFKKLVLGRMSETGGEAAVAACCKPRANRRTPLTCRTMKHGACSMVLQRRGGHSNAPKSVGNWANWANCSEVVVKTTEIAVDS